MPRNPRRVAFNFQNKAKKRESRPNVYEGPVPAADGTMEVAKSQEPASGEAAASRSAGRRASGRGRARGVVYSEYLRQELVKFGAVTLTLFAIVIVAAIIYK